MPFVHLRHSFKKIRMKSYKAMILVAFIILTTSAGSKSQQEFNHIDRISAEFSRVEHPAGRITVSDPVKLWKDDLCTPGYSAGCSDGDGFTDFAVAEIENYNTGCENNAGNGWSQYLEMGPAVLIPGISHDFFMKTGYNNQYVTIWVDFNDDQELAPEEKILFDFEMETAGVMYTVPVEIPADATPGQHYMRARAHWSASCNDPCDDYQYGEAEDYYVIIGVPSFGSIDGTVTLLLNGSAVDGASVTLAGIYNYTTLTLSNGSYSIENVMVGDYTVSCAKEGYNSLTAQVTIIENVVSTQDFQLTQPTIEIAPASVSVTLDQNATAEETVAITNNGNGMLDWSASIVISGENSEDFMDLQFQYPVATGGGEAGIETDGSYFYTSKWTGANIYKYDLDGNYIGTFTIAGVSGIRDMAYDGNYFYGGAGFSTVYEMDFNNHILVSSFTAPTDVRAIAYNGDLDVFYANNWNSPIVRFDKAGNNLGSFNVGPEGGEYYGFAYDNATLGGPFLWGYAQIGDSDNEIIQIQLPSGSETGFTLDVATKLTGLIYEKAGGLFTFPNLVAGKWTLGGLVQNEWIWGLELADAQTWISVSPNSGSIGGGLNQDVTISFDASGLDPGIYHAEIHFTSVPNVGVPVVLAEMIVEAITIIPNRVAGSPDILVFPNPANDMLYIQSDAQVTQVIIYNTSGQTILSENKIDGIINLNTGQMEPGTYLLRLNSETGVVIRKFIVK